IRDFHVTGVQTCALPISHWRYEREKLEPAFGNKTRVVIINTPLNPSASVMSRAELELVADLCRKRGAVCVSDEVWEHVLFDGARSEERRVGRGGGFGGRE